MKAQEKFNIIKSYTLLESINVKHYRKLYNFSFYIDTDNDICIMLNNNFIGTCDISDFSGENSNVSVKRFLTKIIDEHNECKAINNNYYRGCQSEE